MIERQAPDIIKQLLAVLPEEGTPEYDALARELEAHGLKYGVLAGSQHGDDWYYTANDDDGYAKQGDYNLNEHNFENTASYRSSRSTKLPGQSVKEYITQAVTAELHAFTMYVHGRDDDADIVKMEIRFQLPLFSVVDGEKEITELTGSPSDVPPSESEVDSGLVGQTADEAGLESESQAFSAWQEGEPVETKADLDAYVENLEEKLQTTGDDAQLANVDLQNALQQQQQTLQMMSNISKMLHDTAMSILRKIGS